jgi:predicted secreted protein
MRTKNVFLLSGLVVIAAIAAGTVIGVSLTNKPIKDLSPSTMYLTENDNGTTVSMKKGDQVNLTLRNYGDGGYAWVITDIDDEALSLKNNFTWGSSGLLGDFGKDTWVFSAEKIGSTTLGLECRRSWDQNDICQKLVIEVEIV